MNPQNILSKWIWKTSAAVSCKTVRALCANALPELTWWLPQKCHLLTLKLLIAPPLSFTFYSPKTREMKRFCRFKNESLPKDLLQHHSLELVCWSSLPVTSSSRQSPRLQAAAGAEEATRGAVGWPPRGRCPLPTWQDPPRALSSRTTGKA